jgi:hypothetical protein
MAVMAVPVLNYSCENWTTNRSGKRKIESAGTKLARSVAGFDLLHFKRYRPTGVRNYLNMCIRNLNEEVEN